MIHFSLTDGKRRVKVELSYKLDEDLFEKYKSICESLGIKFDGEVQGRACTLDSVPEAMETFVAAGFKCTYSEDVLNNIQKLAAKIEEDTRSAEKRLIKMEKSLAKKGQKLFPYQRTGIQWLAPRRRSILSDEMGLGKTIQVLMAVPEKTPSLVICPGVAKGVWYREARKWRPDIMPYIFEGRGTFCWPKPGEMYIFNYDILPGEPPENCPKHLNIIFDEAHALKNVKAKRTKFSRALASETIKNHGKGIMTTGSPMLNRPPELFTVLETLDLATDAFGNWRNFLRLFNGTPIPGGFDWGLPEPEVASLLKKVMLVRKRKDVQPDLPTKIYNDTMIKLFDKEVQKELDEIIKDLENAGLELGKVTLEELQKEQLIFERISAIRAKLALAKIPMMLEFVEQYEENDEPLIVASAHRAPIEALGQREGWLTLTGADSAEQKTKIAEAFQSGKYKGIGLTIQAGGVAITLTHAAHMLFVDRMWTPALNDQAEDRICRIGQTRGCQIYDLICQHPVEERVHELLTIKRRLIEARVDSAKVIDTDVVSYNLRLDILDKVTVKDRPEPIKRFQQTLDKNSLIKVDETIKMRLPTRDAKSPIEMWAKNGCLQLAATDPDKARVINNIGFNKFDNVLGHDFSKKIRNGGLTENQWKALINMCKKYQRQIGPIPNIEVKHAS